MPQLINAAQRVAITYRQAQHWADKGYIKTTMEDRHGEPVDPQFAGTGFNRMIAASEMEHLRLMALLVKAGFKPDVASLRARTLLRGSPSRIGVFHGTPLVLDFKKEES